MIAATAALARRVTRAEYETLPEGPPYYELIDGELIEMSLRPFRPHVRLEMRLAQLLGNFIDHLAQELAGELVREPNLYLPGTKISITPIYCISLPNKTFLTISMVSTAPL